MKWGRMPSQKRNEADGFGFPIIVNCPLSIVNWREVIILAKKPDEEKDISFPNQKIVNINLEHEMENAYIEYAMSVIVGRALPDVRDG